MVLLLLSSALGLGAERAPWTTGRVIGWPNPPPPYTVQRLGSSIAFNHPVDLSFMPGTDRLFVAEQSGKLWSFVPGAPDSAPDLAIDLRQHHRPFDNILGFTVHPGFATNRYIYINYNEPGGRENGAIVSRFTVRASDPPVVDPASERVIIRWFSGGHNGCTLAFGNDGFLYISTGDAASPDPPDGERKTGQDNSDLLACILRIDVDHTDGTNAYTAPADNPFIDLPNTRPEVWAFGFRNPFRMSFDRVTGDLWVGDVGWEQWEMIYRVERGGNYGWPITEGPNLHVRRDIKQGPGPILPPMVALPHWEAASITGGFVYHGKKHSELNGAYVYGDWETGKFWALRQADGKLIANDELCDTSLKPTAFALDPDGELVILDYSGGLYEFAPNDAPSANESFPRQLSETGLFGSVNPLKPASGTIPYRIAAPMWNDHASAQWLLAIPGPSAIETRGGVGNIAGATWAFPSNTVLARTLTLEFEAGRPASVRPIETQLLHWDGQAWQPYSYRWRPDATDADLVGDVGTNDTFRVIDATAPGGTRSTPWRFMTRAECFRCHNAWAGETLTLNWLQLGSPDDRESQASRLVHAGALKIRPGPGSSAVLVDPYDHAFPIAQRARSWLHVNCAPCHRFGAGGAVAIHLDYEKRVEELRAVDIKASRGDFGLPDSRIIASGDPFRSSLFYRISTEGAGHMPQIGSRLVDPEGVRVVRDWIRSLPPQKATAPDEVAKMRDEHLRRLERQDDPTREQTMASLLSSMDGSLALLDHVGEWTTFRAAAAQAAAAHTNVLVRDLFQHFLPPDQRRVTLGTDIQAQSILSLAGDARRGRALFGGAAQCAQCHPFEGGGKSFGPDLAGLGRKYSRAQLLEQILYPSKIVAPEFKSITVTLKDGSEFNGFILRRTPTELVLKDQNLSEQSLKQSDIADLYESSLSAMAEGLLAPLTALEAADLLEYLFVTRALLPASPP